MESKLSKRWWLLLIAGVAYAILGVVIWKYPGETVLGATIYIGMLLFITGFSYIGLAIGGVEKRGWYLAGGIIDILIAGLIMFNPLDSASMLVLTIGFWFVFKGVMMFTEAFSLKKSGYNLWWINIISGLLITIFGWMITGRPLAGMMAVVAFASWSFWIKGIVLITNAFGLKALGNIEEKVESAA